MSHGRASGFANPGFGVGHLLFLTAVAALALLVDARRLRMVSGYVSASPVGTSIHVAWLELP